MIIVDNALKARQRANNPIKVAMVGAGFMGRGIALQICNSVPGMKLVAIANRHREAAVRAYQEAGIDQVTTIETVSQMENAVGQGQYAVTEDAMTVCRAAGIDAVIEVTGTIEFGANVVYTAIQNEKHVIVMNAELDGTIGPILKVYADKKSVIITNADGDQPGVIMNLYRFVKGIGVRPVLCGNIKGLHDPYRNPTTQESFARKWGQQPTMVTSFADGTKISFEQAIVANATGMGVARRGMYGPSVEAGTPITEAVERYPLYSLLGGPGIVDYLVGAEPSPGVFVVGTHDHPRQKHYLHLYKLGTGPFYCFYTPYHLCHFEVPNTVARAVLFSDAAVSPIGPLQVEVVATAKIDLKSGQVLDGLGGYMTYGLCENATAVRTEELLPIGLAEGCRLKTDIPKDRVLKNEDVLLPEGRFVDKLRAEQDEHFASTAAT
jgi:predicted homoserine dehydrogenase-like protein